MLFHTCWNKVIYMFIINNFTSTCMTYWLSSLFRGMCQKPPFQTGEIQGRSWVLNLMRCSLRSPENKYHCRHTLDESICFIPDGQGFTRERKTRLLQLEEERKEPQPIPSSRPMTTAEFAVVCEVLWKICCTTQTAYQKKNIFAVQLVWKKKGYQLVQVFKPNSIYRYPCCNGFLSSFFYWSEKAIAALKFKEICYNLAQIWLRNRKKSLCKNLFVLLFSCKCNIIVFFFLQQSVHRAFRSFSLFCHGLLAGDALTSNT